MKIGDLVKADGYLSYVGGKMGIVIKVQDVEYCIGVYVFMNNGVHLIRVENLVVVSESR